MKGLTIKILPDERLRIPALGGEKRLEEHWKLEDEDQAMLDSLGLGFEPQPTGETFLTPVIVETTRPPVLTKDVMGELREHLRIGNEDGFLITEEQLIYVLEHHQGQLPRSMDAEAFVRRGGTTLRAAIDWYKEGFDVGLYELNPDTYMLDIEARKTWFLLPLSR